MFAADLENPWIAAVREAPRRRPAALVALIGLGVALALAIASRAAVPAAGQVVASLLAFVGLGVAAIIGTRLEGRRLWPRESFGPAAGFGGLALGLGAVFACAAVASIAGATGMIVGPPLAPLGAIVAALLVAALGAAAQEMFFRGWIQPVLGAAWGVWPGVLITAAAFAALHLAAGAHGLLVAVNLVLAGLLLGLLALRSGGLAAPTAAHLMWTWTGFIGPAASPAGVVAQVRLHGPTLWSGADQGLGGSLAATVVLLVLIATILTVSSQAAPARAPKA
jgi:membrane protease YdiL (CAAX protease family)